MYIYTAGHGDCVSYDTCECEPGWLTEDCSVASCPDANHCSSQGLCVFPNQCECFDGYQGADCSEPMTENLHTPVFEAELYSATVSEKTEVPRTVVTVKADDEDEGQNGQVREWVFLNGENRVA